MISHEDAIEIVRSAVGDVLDPQVSNSLRADSPLLVTPREGALTPADAVALADAIAIRAGRVGARCELGDGDFTGPDGAGPVVTVADLAGGVQARWVSEEDRDTSAWVGP